MTSKVNEGHSSSLWLATGLRCGVMLADRTSRYALTGGAVLGSSLSAALLTLRLLAKRQTPWAVNSIKQLGKYNWRLLPPLSLCLASLSLSILAIGLIFRKEGKTYYYTSQLFELCKQKNPNPKDVKNCIEQGAQVNQIARSKENTWKFTPLALCAGLVENPEVIKTLLDNGADINKTPQGGLSALAFACGRNNFKGNLAIIKELLEANPTLSDKEKKTLKEHSDKEWYPFLKDLLEDQIETV